MMRLGQFHVGLSLMLLAASSATAQVISPVLSAGGTVHADGTILVLGQFATGIVSQSSESIAQGATPCWIDGATCAGDLDGDQDVDIQDLATLLGHFGTASGATPEDGDADGDGDVDIQDLASLLSVFGSTCP